MKKRETFYIRFAKNILKALKIRQARLYGSKYSKKTYTLHQHIVLLAMREFQKGKGYRQFCEELPDYVLLLVYLGLSCIPHFTTLHKVAQRLKNTALDYMILGFVRKAKFRSGSDSTGLSCQHSTYYYEQRLEHFRKKKGKKPGRPRKRRIKKHQYTDLFMDLDAQLILSTTCLRGKQSDQKRMRQTVQKALTIFDRVISHDADRGYDAEYNHQYVRETMHAEDNLKLKNINVPIHRTKGHYRKQAKRKLHKKLGRPRKNHRNKAESIIFVMKKVCGEHLTATKAIMQRKQTKFRVLAYNAYRKTKTLFHKDFYKALP